MTNNTLIVIAGATAIGKTALAIDVAKHYKTSIISADSRQCYNELNIGVAKPNAEQLQQVHHYFINSHSIHETVNAAVFEQYALQATQQIFKQNKIAVMVGGTGLYINAFCNGIDEIPAIDDDTKTFVAKHYNQFGMEWLQQQLQEKDEHFWNTTTEQKNPHRLIRALEVLLSTQQSITTFKTNTKAKRNFNIIKIALQMDRELLIERINRRVDVMIEEGLENEAQQLFQYKRLNALQTVGYTEWVDYFDNKTDKQTTIKKIKTSTRQYAKRQVTWFKKDKNYNWLKANDSNVLQQCIHLIEQ